MKVFLVLLLGFGTFFIESRCYADGDRDDSVYSYTDYEALYQDAVYNRTVNGCRDRIDAWMAADDGKGSSVYNDTVGFRDELFMRGVWKQMVDKAHAHETIIEGRSGNFDIYLMQGSYEYYYRSTSHPAEFSVSLFQNVSGTLGFRGKKSKKQHVGYAESAYLSLHGIYNTHSGEICIIGCMRDSTIAITNATRPETYDPLSREGYVDCSFRGILMLSGPPSETTRLIAKGTLESLRNATDGLHFSPISLSGSPVKSRDQKYLYVTDRLVQSLLFVVEGVLIVIQIVYTIRHTEGFFVSMLMVLVQIVLEGFNTARLLYVPLRLLTFRQFKFLFTAWSLVAWLLDFIIVILNMIFFIAVFRKRRIAVKADVQNRPKELPLAIVCISVYGGVGAILWSLENFETYLAVVKSWFLLPQLIANVFWDIRCRPLHPAYILGLSLCRIAKVSYDTFRPTIYGYDDINSYGDMLFWSTLITVISFMTYGLLQQYYGGRCFLPGRWFGYKQLPHSYAASERSAQRSDDTTIELGKC